MKHIKVFDTELAFETYAASADLVVPNLSYCKDVKSVHYIKEYGRSYYTNCYLTFEALEDTVFSIVYANYSSNYITQAMRESFSYSIDDGKTWITFTTPNDTYAGTALTTPTIHAGQKVLWKGIGNQNYNMSAYCKITATGAFNAYGNIMSLLYGDNFAGQTVLPGTTQTLTWLFYGNSGLINAENLILPATTLTTKCYSNMFQSCTSLTKAPSQLPATTLTQQCYAAMFAQCTSLTTAPELPATTLATYCYSNMFSSCTSLTAAPELPATTLATYCYNGLFAQCTSLTTAPELPATTLVNYCYDMMFYGCRSLNYIKAMFTTTPSSTYTGGWVSNVAATGTFVKNSAATWNVTDTYGVPSGWTVQYATAK